MIATLLFNGRFIPSWQLWAQPAAGAGKTVTVLSGAVDTTPPSPGTVNDGSGADIDLQAGVTALRANWSGFYDLESGLLLYEYAFGTTPGGSDVAGWTSAGLATIVTLSGLSLLDQTTYYASVRATDVAGNVSQEASSDGVTVDSAIGIFTDGFESGDTSRWEEPPHDPHASRLRPSPCPREMEARGSLSGGGERRCSIPAGERCEVLAGSRWVPRDSHSFQSGSLPDPCQRY